MSRFCALLVDDMPETMVLMQHVLALKSIDWRFAKSSMEAEHLLGEIHPHLIVLDVNLGPRDNGLKWLKKIRRGKFRHVPVIMMTSSRFRDDVEAALKEGINDYIMKPADFELLSKKILAVKARLEAKPTYAFSAERSHGPITASITIPAEIKGINETGLCVSSCIDNDAPVDFVDFDSRLFEEIGAGRPSRLAVLDSQRDSRDRKEGLRRNLCLAKGWSDKDMAQVRAFIREMKLSRRF